MLALWRVSIIEENNCEWDGDIEGNREIGMRLHSLLNVRLIRKCRPFEIGFQGVKKVTAAVSARE